MPTRNCHLDLIKCIACVAVVGLHAVGMNDYTCYYLCGCGVPLFFMVNGYLMFSKTELTCSYAFHKILQILKVVFLWNLLIAIPVLLFRQKLVNPFSLTLNSLLQKSYLWHFWFFGALMLIDLILPSVHRLFQKKTVVIVILWGLLWGTCLTMSILSMTKGYSLHAYVPQSLRLWTWLFYFLTGGLMTRILPKLDSLPLAIHGLLVILFAAVNNFALKKIGLYLTHARLAEYYYDNLSSVLFYLLLFAFLMRITIPRSLSGKISVLSSLTMGIFILHPILLAGIHSFYTPAGSALSFLFWLALTLLSLLIAFVMSKLPVIKTLIKL